jgi:hypothetical protein
MADTATDVAMRFMVFLPRWVAGMHPEGARCT